MSDTTYMGYANYETFTLHMEIHNQGRELQEMYQEFTQEAYDSAEADDVFTRLERAELDLCDTLKDCFEEQLPELEGWQGTLLQSAFSAIVWMELAKELMEGVER